MPTADAPTCRYAIGNDIPVAYLQKMSAVDICICFTFIKNVHIRASRLHIYATCLQVMTSTPDNSIPTTGTHPAKSYSRESGPEVGLIVRL